MNLFQRDKLYIFRERSYGFAIPQVLILGVGIVVGVSGLMAASILGLTGSRINRQELIAQASSYSGITTLRSLLNDSSQSGLFHYFWVVNNNAQKVSECNQSNPCPNPSNEYWPDDEWCEGSTDCYGRQKAPKCIPNQGIGWNNIIDTFNIFFDNEADSVGTDLDNSKRNFDQGFNVTSTNYTGTEKYGVSSILIEGKATSKDFNKQTASNKLRVNIQVNSNTSEEGFGFLSIGENQLDGEDSLFLGNLTVTPVNLSKGSIIWRRNLEDYSECGNLLDQAKANGSSLPGVGNGGIWVQPIGLPKQPRLSNVDDLGILICTPTEIVRQGTNCILDAANTSEKVYRIHSLYSKGPGSSFEISTTDNSKIILEIMGDIDISNGGIFCHKDGLDSCGSGKAENLTILFKQKTKIKGNKIVCNAKETGGVQLNYPGEDFSSYQYPIDNNQFPGSSFLIDNTGDNASEQFGAFIYGPKVTFLSVRPESPFTQITNSEGGASSAGMIVASRASYGWIKNTLGDSLDDQMVNIVLTPDSRLIPYLGQYEENDSSEIEIVGVGYKVNPLPQNSNLNPSANRVFLIYNKGGTPSYSLRTFDVQNINSASHKSSEYSYPRAFAKMHIKDTTTNVDLPADLESQYARMWLETFQIEVQRLNLDSTRNFSGAAWVKNLCFDDYGEKTWDFSKTFIDGLSEWHGEEFNWGVRYYRGRSIILWDTLRDFKS